MTKNIIKYDLNLNVIRNNYPKSILLDIVETFYPLKGWKQTKNTINSNTTITEVEQKIKLRIANGATHFQFMIKDQYGQIRYPDYSVNELLRIVTFFAESQLN
jgi:hypothetical protein